MKKIIVISEAVKEKSIECDMYISPPWKDRVEAIGEFVFTLKDMDTYLMYSFNALRFNSMDGEEDNKFAEFIKYPLFKIKITDPNEVKEMREKFKEMEKKFKVNDGESDEDHEAWAELKLYDDAYISFPKSQVIINNVHKIDSNWV